MSGIIFVLLAIGWAVYLLPKALKRNDELDRSRPVEEFSDAVRVLGRGVANIVAGPDAGPVETAAAAPVRTISREAARSAARRRRRVLALLLTTLAVVTLTSYLAYTPWFTTAIPGALVVAFLVVARLTVRAQQVRLTAPDQHRTAYPDLDTALDVQPVETSLDVEASRDLEADLATEDTQGLSREELAAAVAAPVLDEGGLWDPLPVTLPTYVNKARARRTVRSIEITGATTGITSSGHDAADSALAAEAREAEQQAAGEVVEAHLDDAKAAGA